MSFHKQDFSSRFAAMGDEAEGIFFQLYPNEYLPLGFNRPPFSMKGMPVNMRAIPDAVGRLNFVEIQGIGRDRTLKLKTPKMDALCVWNDYIGPVDLFIWDRTERQTFRAPLKSWLHAAAEYGEADKYPEGTPILKLHIDGFPVEGCPLPDDFTEGVSSQS